MEQLAKIFAVIACVVGLAFAVTFMVLLLMLAVKFV